MPLASCNPVECETFHFLSLLWRPSSGRATRRWEECEVDGANLQAKLCGWCCLGLLQVVRDAFFYVIGQMHVSAWKMRISLRILLRHSTCSGRGPYSRRPRSGQKKYARRDSHVHLALHDELVSKAFQGRHGRAFLFGNVYVE
jgi:hypothetical protein